MKLETLESRSLFSVTVSEGYPGFYEIQGSSGDDVIQAQINMAEQTLDVNGQTYTDVEYVVAYGYAGNDFICLTSVDGSGIIGASIDLGPGNDVGVLGVDGVLFAGQGNDQVYLLDSFRGQAYGDSGSDYMNISVNCVDAEVRGGEGDDYIDCSQNYYGIAIFGNSGNDTIYGSAYADQIFGGEGDDFIDAGEGDDTIHAAGGGRDEIFGGDGQDYTYVDDADVVGGDIENVYYV
jgi:Ca2+-binding RTX toxin-like protein